MAEVTTTKNHKKQQAVYLFPVELINRFPVQVENKNAESILGESGLAGQLKKMLAKGMPTAELSHHLAGEGEAGKNHRNGSSPKKVLTFVDWNSFANRYQKNAHINPKYCRKTLIFPAELLSNLTPGSRLFIARRWFMGIEYSHQIFHPSARGDFLIWG